MAITQASAIQAFGQVGENPIGFGQDVSVPVCEGLNIAYASFQALYVQYQKHHFVVEGSEFTQLHDLFQENYDAVQEHAHDLAERLNGLGGIPAGTFATLADLCCFTPEADGAFDGRQMVSSDLEAEQAILTMLRRQASQAESVGDRATRYLYEEILLKTEDRAFHLDHFLAHDSLTLGFVPASGSH